VIRGRPVLLLALLAGLAAPPAPAGENGRADPAPEAAGTPAEEAAGTVGSPGRDLPMPRFSDQPFRPMAPGRSGEHRGEAGCCSREHD
jgi:hypothetical protein